MITRLSTRLVWLDACCIHMLLGRSCFWSWEVVLVILLCSCASCLSVGQHRQQKEAVLPLIAQSANMIGINMWCGVASWNALLWWRPSLNIFIFVATFSPPPPSLSLYLSWLSSQPHRSQAKICFSFSLPLSHLVPSPGGCFMLCSHLRFSRDENNTLVAR